jgi:hypothetical protein
MIIFMLLTQVLEGYPIKNSSAASDDPRVYDDVDLFSKKMSSSGLVHKKYLK